MPNKMPPVVNNHEAKRYIAKLKPFQNYGATFSADIIQKGDGFSIGEAPPEVHRMLGRAVKNGDVYVVFSYWTPIGWITHPGGEDFVIPDRVYSPTTRRHQTILGQAAQIYGMTRKMEESNG